jgi:ADP-ribosylglycohydrolase
MMKQSPLTMYYAISNISEKQMNKEITTYSCITHANKISVVSAIVHNKMLVNLLLSN